MRAARLLRWARRRAGLTQRTLAQRAGVPQSTIGRIETGAIDPRVSTLRQLVRACGYDLEVEPALGTGVDRTHFAALLALTPEERIAQVEQAVLDVWKLRQATSAARARAR